LQEMPKKGLYACMMVIGFLCGILWGVLSVGYYKKMTTAITNGNTEEAWANARKIRNVTIVGVIVAVLVIIGRTAKI